MGGRTKAIVLAMVVWMILAGSVVAEQPRARLSLDASSMASRNMVIFVEDQHGDLTENAEVVIRDRATYNTVAVLHTNADGYAQVELDPETWYIVHVYYVDHGSREFWSYDYIKAEDWWSIYPYGIKRLRRDDPWIDKVTTPTGVVALGDTARFAAELDHLMEQTNFDLWCRVTLIIDDDGLEPYLYEELSDEQIISDGFVPFVFEPTMELPGVYQVRFVLERKFELNDWFISDDMGWSWALTVGEGNADLIGLVYLDMNGDGTHGPDEALGVGALVRAYDALGEPVAQAFGNNDGRVLFPSLPVGDYDLRIEEAPAYLGRPRDAYHIHVSGSITNTIEIPLDPWRVGIPLVTIE